MIEEGRVHIPSQPHYGFIRQLIEGHQRGARQRMAGAKHHLKWVAEKWDEFQIGMAHAAGEECAVQGSFDQFVQQVRAGRPSELQAGRGTGFVACAGNQ